MTKADFTEIWTGREAFDRNPSQLMPIYANLVGRLELVSFSDRYALDVGIGMGADAAYLARRGYIVDGLDTCSVSTNKVAQAAKKIGLPIRTHTTDINNFTPNISGYDVGLAIKLLHVQTPIEQSITLQRLEQMIKPGGHVIIRALTNETQNATTEHPGLLAPGEVYRRFAEWNICYQKSSVHVPCKNKRNEDSIQVFDDMIAQKR